MNLRRETILFNNFIGHLDWHWKANVETYRRIFHSSKNTELKKRKVLCVAESEQKGYIRIELFLLLLIVHTVCMQYILQILWYFACLSFNNICVFFLFSLKRREEKKNLICWVNVNGCVWNLSVKQDRIWNICDPLNLEKKMLKLFHLWKLIKKINQKH